MDARHRRGRDAEALVAAHLQSEGWQILARNHREAGVEIDLIAARDGRVRFVEVKARDLSDPLAQQALSGAQQSRLQRAGDHWMLARAGPGSPWTEGCFLLALVGTDGAIQLIDDPFDG